MLRTALLCMCIALSACQTRRHEEALSVVEASETFGPSYGEVCLLIVVTPNTATPRWTFAGSNIFAETARLTASTGSYVSGAIISRPEEARGTYRDDAWAVAFACPLEFMNEAGLPQEVERSSKTNIQITVSGFWRAVELSAVVDLNRLDQVCGATNPQ